MKVRKLVELLGSLDQDGDVFVAPVPDVNGYYSDFLPSVGVAEGGDFILGLLGETVNEGEVVITWGGRPV